MAQEIRIIRPNDVRSEDVDSLMWVQRLSTLLDSKFIIPGTKIRFGLDPILSLFPVFGDLITYLISAALIYTMHRHGASGKVVVKMLLNSTADAIVGAIPIVGTVFDVFYRSNERNVKLLKEHYLEGKHHGSGRGLMIIVAFVGLAIVVAISYGILKLMEALF